MCFAGFYGRQCDHSCPGPGATETETAVNNTCYRHGACFSSGESEGSCLCQTGYAGTDEYNRTSCADCAQPIDPALPKYYGRYNTRFGKNAIDGSGLKIGLNLDCYLCPGGGVCSGHGSCDSGKDGTGVCTCGEGYSGTACQIRTGVPKDTLPKERPSVRSAQLASSLPLMVPLRVLSVAKRHTLINLEPGIVQAALH